MLQRHDTDAHHDGLHREKVSENKSELSQNHGHSVALAWYVLGVRDAHVLRHFPAKEVYSN